MDSGCAVKNTGDDNPGRARSRTNSINAADKLKLFEVIRKLQFEDILNNEKNCRSINQQKMNAWVEIVIAFNAIASVKRSAAQLKGIYRTGLAAFRQTVADPNKTNDSLAISRTAGDDDGGSAFRSTKPNTNPLLPRFVQENSLPENSGCCMDDFLQDSIYTNEHEGTVITEVIYNSLAGSPTLSATSDEHGQPIKKRQNRNYVRPNTSPILMKSRFVKCRRPRTWIVAKREMYENYAMAAAERSKREQKESTMKIELIKEKILYYRELRENLQYELSSFIHN